MSFTAFGTSFQPQAATPAAGFALQNGTPTILTWTPPNDGKLHRFIVFASLVVTSAETGGGINQTFNDPSGAPRSQGLFNGGLGAGFASPNNFSYVVQGGQPVTIVQSSALTLGAATLWAEIWGVVIIGMLQNKLRREETSPTGNAPNATHNEKRTDTDKSLLV